MLNPDLRGVLKNHLSRYSLVIATAKRAREISDEIEESHEIVTEKTITTAINEILDGKYIIEEPEEIRNL